MKEFGHWGPKFTRSRDGRDVTCGKMSYFQSQMYLDESIESIVDSDLEDGKLPKLLTSPLYAQRASVDFPQNYMVGQPRQ